MHPRARALNASRSDQTTAPGQVQPQDALAPKGKGKLVQDELMADDDDEDDEEDDDEEEDDEDEDMAEVPDPTPSAKVSR